MKQTKLLSLCTLAAGMLAFAPQTALAQESNPDVFGLDAARKSNNVSDVEQAEDGSWSITTIGSDPFVATTPLSRNLADDECTLTFEYKASKDDALEFFFSTDAGITYATGKSIHLGVAPKAEEWTRVSIDITKARQEWEWGKKGQTLRLDCGTEEGLKFQIRDLRVTTEPANVFQAYEVDDEAIQINSQEDFDRWIADFDGGFIVSGYLPYTDVDLNCDVVAAGDGNLIERYYGVFNGNFHKITMNIHGPAVPPSTGTGTCFMHYLDGTVKNVYFDGEIEGATKFLGTVACDINATGMLENVWSEVNLISHISGDGTHGGLAGRILGGVLKNVCFAGKISNPDGVTNRCGGVIGWVNNPSVFDGVLMLGDISELNEDALNAVIGRNSNNTDANIDDRGIYYVDNGMHAPATAMAISEEDLASGLVTFLLNGDQREIAWYQTLGVDALPTFDSTHKQVFAVADLGCDGSILSTDFSFNNESGSTVPDHSYVDGKCENCGEAQPGFVELVDGWYEIRTPEQFCYIAAVASANPSINIKIMEDLDMAGYDYTPIMGGYSGTLDGQHHVISNLVIVNPETRGQALIAQAGPCTLKNLTLDATCSIEGAGYSAGFVGESTASGTITMEGLFMHGNVIAHGANAAAIYACNMGTVATSVVMINCGMTGSVTGDLQSGLMTGWFGGKGNVTNCWAIGSVTGSDADAAGQFSRPATGDDKFTNCFTVQGKRDAYTTVSADAGETGELTWLLNGKSFINPTWYQNLEEGDAYPSLDPSRGIVYPTPDGYASADLSDPASFSTFLEAFSGVAKQYLESEDVQEYAALALVEEYAAIVESYDAVTTMEEFEPVYKAEQAKKSELAASIKAYKAYEVAVLDVAATLAARTDFSGDDRDFLEEEYLEGTLEPGENEKAPNGSFEVIMEQRTLTAAQLTAEIELVRELLRVAVANGYAAGTELTDMLVNANFAQQWTGWTGQFTAAVASKREGSTMHAVEGFGAGPWNMYQEITVGKTGIYELKIGGAWRPFNEWTYNSIEYYPYIYLNNNVNYLQSNIEDYMPKDEAIDGVNCNLNPAWLPDLAFLGEEGDTLGYVMHGQQSICDAMEAGRYDNRILIHLQAGETLRVGVCHPHSGFKAGANEWVGFGDIHLYYQGDIEESTEALDRVLASMTARANNMMAIPYSVDENYVRFPNWSNALKARVNAALEKAAATDPATKYEAIEELSAAFLEIIDNKKAYRQYFATVEAAHAAAYAAADLDPENCGYMVNLADQILAEGMAAYEAGEMTTEEALACEVAKQLPVTPTIDENGTYHIANSAQYMQFAALANATTTDANGMVYNVVLDGDVAMDASMIIQHFYGTFDGQDHTLTVNIVREEAGAAPFFALRKGAVVKNLIVRGDITTTNKFAAGIAAHSYDGSTMERIQSYVNIVADQSGDGTHGGILAVNDSGNGVIRNSLFAGSMSGAASNCNGGLVGWSGTSATAINCLVIANITCDPGSSNIIGRANTYAQNCFYVTPYGGAPAGATQITEAELASGFATLGLNGGVSRPDVAWRQNLGEDIIPTLDPTHKIVYMGNDGNYTNELQNEIQKHMGTKDDPFIINTATDMALLRSMMTPGRINYIQLGADIDMAGIDNWYPLNMAEDKAGSFSYQNYVDFDGQGHVIKNFTMNNPTQDYSSFFGILIGDVRNVGFENANVVCEASGTGILAGYMGHDQALNGDITKRMSTLTNVWVTGKLFVSTGYAGGMIGNVGGPSTFTNCYTNIAITSAAPYTGGIVGRVRDFVGMNNVYAAGKIDVTGENVGGIVGGGHQLTTHAAKYNNVVVWNNTDQNFGPVPEPTNEVLPPADLLDVVFSADGTITDQSAMANNLEVFGDVVIQENEKFGTPAYMTNAPKPSAPVSFIKVDMSQNQALKDAIADGYTMECAFVIRQDSWSEIIKPFCATQSGGFGLELAANGAMSHIAYTKAGDAAASYKRASCGYVIAPNRYYHMVGVFDKTAEKIVLYVNGNRSEGSAPGDLLFPTAEVAQWIGIGADPSSNLNVGQSGGNFEILSARMYDQPMTDRQAQALFLKHQYNTNLFDGAEMENISFFDGNNFAALQTEVKGWGAPWQCGMAEGEYPTFDGTHTGIDGVKSQATDKIYNINGIEVEKAQDGIFIINGKKVMVK